ncbi:MAG: hypothetical protein H0V62_01635 [Gammaproteobacteria bacterium]|nr:hypothetical protein [Gammaproteobacteria bacterium]
MKVNKAAYIARWRIAEMETWNQEFVDMEVPGHFTFARDGLGSFQFGLVQGEIDWRIEAIGADTRLTFSWAGSDDCDPSSGRGCARIENGELSGRIFIHLGDESGFRAVKTG